LLIKLSLGLLYSNFHLMPLIQDILQPFFIPRAILIILLMHFAQYYIFILIKFRLNLSLFNWFIHKIVIWDLFSRLKDKSCQIAIHLLFIVIILLVVALLTSINVGGSFIFFPYILQILECFFILLTVFKVIVCSLDIVKRQSLLE
jgi:hypothetical protein